MQITIENYEVFAVDYFENNLSSTDRLAFESFLDNHPEIRREINELDWILIPPAEVVYHQKEKLLKRQRLFVLNGKTVLSVAAAILFLLTFTFLLRNQLNNTELAPEMANDTEMEELLNQSESQNIPADDLVVEKPLSESQDPVNDEKISSSLVSNRDFDKLQNEDIQNDVVKATDQTEFEDLNPIISTNEVQQIDDNLSEYVLTENIQEVREIIDVTSIEIQARIPVLQKDPLSIEPFVLPEVDVFDRPSLMTALARIVPSGRFGRQKQTLKEALLPEYMQGQ